MVSRKRKLVKRTGGSGRVDDERFGDGEDLLGREWKGGKGGGELGLNESLGALGKRGAE